MKATQSFAQRESSTNHKYFFHFNVVSDLTLYSHVENISINHLPALYKNLNKL